MIYKITPTMISITFDEKVLNYKNAKNVSTLESRIMMEKPTRYQ
jgi:hypothetical protein